MAADPDDIAAAIRPATIETWASPAIQARYPSARDGSRDPAEGFFDSAADAASALAMRAGLIGTERRRFTVTAADLVWPSPAAGVPIVNLFDPELSVDAALLVARVEVNLEEETTLFEVFG